MYGKRLGIVGHQETVNQNHNPESLHPGQNGEWTETGDDGRYGQGRGETGLLAHCLYTATRAASRFLAELKIEQCTV